MGSILNTLSVPLVDAEMGAASRRYSSSHATELLSEDPMRSAHQIVDLLTEGAGVVEATVRGLRERD